MPKIYGYARCSTNEQKQDIKRQIRDLEALGAETIFQDYATGSDTLRQQLSVLQMRIEPGDTIVSTELSRLTRSLHHLCHLMEWAEEHKINFKLGNMTADFTAGEIDPMAEGMVYMLGVFAQLERKITIQRIHSGIAHARSNGKKLGRPAMSKDKLPKPFLKHLPKYQSGELSISEFARLCGCSRPSIHRYLSIAGQR